MQQPISFSNDISPYLPQKRVPWHEVWFLAMFRPSLETYERLSHNYDLLRDKETRVYRRFAVQMVDYIIRNLVAFAALAGTLLMGCLSFLLHWVLGLGDFPWAFPAIIRTSADSDMSSGVAALLVMLLISFFWVMGGVWLLVFANAAHHWTARLLRRQGDKIRLHYLSAAYGVPLIIVMAFVVLLPYGMLLFVLRVAYELILSTIAIKVVYDFPWWKAVAANSVPITVVASALVLWASWLLSPDTRLGLMLR